MTGSGAITGQGVARDVLAPVMDGLACNGEQRRLIANPTPEIDSIVEHLAALARTATAEQRAHLRALLVLTRRLAHSNDTERDCERKVAGAADEWARTLHAAERPAPERQPWTIKSLARELRPALRTLVDADRGRRVPAADLVAARRTVDRVRGAVPTKTLASVSLRHELGSVALATKLHEIVGVIPGGAPCPSSR